MTTYEQKMHEQAALLDDEFLTELAEEDQANSRFDEIEADMTAITQKPVISNYYFKSAGRVMGIITHIIQNPKHKSDLLAITGLTQTVLDKYDSYAGNFPYLNKEGKLVPGRQMNCKMTKKIVIYAALKLGVLINSKDLELFNDNYWNEIFTRRSESISETKPLRDELQLDKLVEDLD